MLKEFLSHRFAYISLVIGLVSFIIMFSLLWTNKEATQILVYILMAFYILWGVSVHTKSKHVTLALVLEYVAVAALAGACLQLLILV